MTAAPPIRRAIYDRVAVALDREPILAQIDDLLGEFERAREAAQYDDFSGGLPDHELVEITTRFRAAIKRLSPAGSEYARIADTINATPAHEVRDLGGILQALRADVAAGYTRTLEELVHADLFSDFLELARRAA